MDFYSGLAVGIAAISAVGVYLSPPFNDWIKRGRDSRDLHKQQLVKHVLKPLIRQIGYFISQEIAISEHQDFEKISAILIEKYANKRFDFVGIEPIYSSLKDVGRNEDEWYDSDLFSDLENHFPRLEEEIKKAQTLIATSMPTYVNLRWDCVGRLDDLMRPRLEDLAKEVYENSDNKKGGITTGEDLERGKLYTTIGIKVALMKLLYYPTDQWPNLNEAAGKINGLMEIVDDTLEDVKVKEISENITKIQTLLVDSLDSIRRHLNAEATSGKTLTGKCHYLGKRSRNQA